MASKTTVPPARLLRWGSLAIQTASILLWVAICALVAAFIIYWINPRVAFSDAARIGRTLDPERARHLLPVVWLGMIGLLYVAVRFLGSLLAIVRTVDIDPFVPDNAARLKRMAWQLAGISLGGVVGERLVNWMARSEQPTGGLMILAALIAVLTLFVLARVFRVGSAMREDLAGTI